jgi:magnesium-transporting ATPase (P-type)
MSKLHYKTKVDLVVAAVTIAIGCFFTYQVSLIESIAEDAIGPRMVPYFLSITMVALGVLVAVSALHFNSRAVSAASSEELDAQAAEEDFGFRDTDITRVIAVVVMGFVYTSLFYAFGYLISTVLSLALMMLVFGNRRPVVVVLLSIVGAFVYDYLFMNLMGLYDPPGAYFDLARFLEDPSLHELTRKLPF